MIASTVMSDTLWFRTERELRDGLQGGTGRGLIMSASALAIYNEKHELVGKGRACAYR